MTLTDVWECFLLALLLLSSGCSHQTVTRHIRVTVCFYCKYENNLSPEELAELEQKMAWVQFTYNYSENQWCVDAQRRDAKPGEMIGGCWKTLHEAEKGILTK